MAKTAQVAAAPTATAPTRRGGGGDGWGTIAHVGAVGLPTRFVGGARAADARMYYGELHAGALNTIDDALHGLMMVSNLSSLCSNMAEAIGGGQGLDPIGVLPSQMTEARVFGQEGSRWNLQIKAVCGPRPSAGVAFDGDEYLTQSWPGRAGANAGDENIVDINFVVQWFVSDASKYVFNIRDPEKNIKDSAESVMREVIGKTKIDFALAEGRDQVRQEAQEALQKILDRNNSGVTVSSLLLAKSDPPPAVIDDFKDVQRARADQERLINEARAYANRIVPEAKGEASKIRESAEAYKQEVIAVADGSSKRFLSVYNEYKEAKDVTRRRIYLETMEKVMQNMNKVIIDNKGGSGVLPYLPLPELKKNLQKEVN